MKRVLVVVVVLTAVLALVGCSAPATQSVNITKAGFEPAAVKVKVGGTVNWTVTDKNPHTVTLGENDSGQLNTGATWTQTFEKAGTYTYYCRYHPTQKCVVTVK